MSQAMTILLDDTPTALGPRGGPVGTEGVCACVGTIITSAGAPSSDSPNQSIFRYFDLFYTEGFLLCTIIMPSFFSMLG